MKKSYKKAFTLSETLIVLVIIAVLAAIVTSALMAHIPKRSVLMFKKTYFGLSQALENVSNNSFFYTERNKNIPRIAGENINTAMTQDVEKILNLPAGTLNENNWLCYTMANSIKHKSINCNACTPNVKDTSLNFVTEDGVGVYGLCGSFMAGGSIPVSKDIYLLIDYPKRSTLSINAITAEAKRVGRNKNTFAFWLQLFPEGSISPVPDNINNKPRLEEEILMDSTVNH